MYTYNALWVDDEWGKDDRLDSIFDKIQSELKDLDISVNWEKCTRADQAGTELLENSNDYRLAVIDAKYKNKNHRFDWKNCRRAAQIHGIPYIIYTNWVKEVEKEIEGEKRDPLLIEYLSKTSSDNETFIKKIKEFFFSPPVRVLHLTDIHYGYSLKDDEKNEAKRMWESLIETLHERHSKMPFDAIAITGDFGYNKPEHDFLEVLPILLKLVRKTIGIENIDRLMIVPGNHDMQWDDFDEGKIAQNPWGHYLNFMQSIYSSRSEVMESTPAWLKEDGTTKYNACSDELIWHRKIPGSAIEAIGFCTTSSNPERDKNHRGYLTETQLRLVEQKWRGDSIPGTIRVALMHHNMFSILSRSDFDEQRIIKNAGSAIHALMHFKCNVVLSGHAHTTNAIRIDSSQLTQQGNEAIGGLTIVSSGTSGGVHDSKIRARTCSILEFSHARDNSKGRELRIKSLVYQDYDRKWTEMPKVSSFVI